LASESATLDSADDEETSSEINSTKPFAKDEGKPARLSRPEHVALRMAVSGRSEAPLEGASLAKPLVCEPTDSAEEA
jgi:hypothetical protein